MTESLLQKLEEKMMLVLMEAEDLRKEVRRLMQENMSLQMEKENHTKKLQELISLLDTVSIRDDAVLDKVPMRDDAVIQ